MATLASDTRNWAQPQTNTNTNIWHKWLAFADGQKKHRTALFLFSLVFQGVVFLPLPAVLIYYYNAPFYIVSVTLVLFFANVIAGMGGSGMRAMLNLFALSVIVHLSMLLAFIL